MNQVVSVSRGMCGIRAAAIAAVMLGLLPATSNAAGPVVEGAIVGGLGGAAIAGVSGGNALKGAAAGAVAGAAIGYIRK